MLIQWGNDLISSQKGASNDLEGKSLMCQYHKMILLALLDNHIILVLTMAGKLSGINFDQLYLCVWL